ncbi:MAG: PLP-dependent cysteine synthase family protein [Halobacteriota archaeon]
MRRDILDTIGSPLVRVDSPAGSTIAAKIESKNPGGSAKDRPALAMIQRAEREGTLTPGDAIVEPTSGNTGIGVAMVGATKGYDVTIVMPASKSPERRAIMRAYGADVELVEGDIADAKDRADELAADGGMVQLRQFENPANPDAHYRTTGQEIVDQVGDRTIDAFVAGVGTGGTLTGIGRRLREEYPDVEIVAVEPADSAVISGEEPTGDSFQGMGPGFISPNLDTDLIDAVETVELPDAEAECRRLAREEGILVGQSSGASNLAAKRVASRLATPDVECPQPPRTVSFGSEVDVEADGGAADCPLVVTVFWDSGERYVSTGLFE